MATPIDVMLKCRKIRRNCALFTSQKFWLLVKSSLLCRSRQKSARANPKHLAHNVPDFIDIGSLSLSAEL